MSDDPFQRTASDGAIETRAGDKFERSDFAAHLARGIVARRGQNSFVVSLQGAWGCGKSSIKNMALETLREMEDAPEVVEFEPWQVRDADSLFATFFGEIALKLDGKGDEAAESKKRLLAYSKSLELGGSVVKSLGTLASVIGVPGGKIVEVVGDKMGDASKIAKEGAEATLEKSLRDQKRELGDLLRKGDRPILVVIDDIDRLEVAEMLLIFQLIKANADFPNFTYLLLMHRERVQEALNDRLGRYGSDYLEKIVQLPIDVPPTNSAQRYALLKGRIAELLESWEVKFSDAEQSDLALLWQSGLSDLLQQPRDVVRALNAIEFSLAIMKSGNELEVNLADFVALESLRTAQPTTYTRLPMVKPFLTQNKPPKSSEAERHLRGSYGLPTEQPTDEEQPGEAEMSDALKDLAILESQGQAARRVLQFIFPSASWALGVQKRPMWEVIPTRPDSRWKIKDERYFDRYFSLSIPIDQISQAEVTRFLQALPNRDELMAQLEAFQMRDLHQTFLLELYEHLSQIPLEHRAQFLAVLFDFWDKQEYYPLLENLFQRVFMGIPEIERKSEIFNEVLGETRAYAIPSLWLRRQQDVLKTLEDQRERFGNVAHDHRHWTDLAGWEKGRDLLVERIERHASTDDFWQRPIVFNAIILWHAVKPDSVKQWVGQQLENSELATFLLRFSGYDFHLPSPDVRFHDQFFEWIEDLPALQRQVEAFNTSAMDGFYDVLFKSFLGYSEQWLQKQAEKQNASSENVS